SHGFNPSAAARSLSRRSSRTIGFVTHAYASEGCGITDPFSLEIMGGIAKGLASLGYDLLILHVDPRSTDWADRYLDSGQVDGFILMTSERKRKHIDHLLEIGAPFIAWGLDGTEYCSVCGDNRRGGKLAAERLLATGRRRPAFIGGPRIESEVQERYRGFAETLAAAGLRLDPALVFYGDFEEGRGASLAAELVDRHSGIDAIFANSDLMAIGAIRSLLARGVRVPEEVAVIGFDDLGLSSYVSPALTTISQHIGMAGTILARDMVAFLSTKTVTRSTVPVELLVRSSA
ncbi:MAG TPA: substrate-binding domain-containing protein, partial [Spirochaetales bacterium]|nr:substrate-binding domain-containing protein [Spirochaetales bacterium]